MTSRILIITLSYVPLCSMKITLFNVTPSKGNSDLVTPCITKVTLSHVTHCNLNSNLCVSPSIPKGSLIRAAV